MSGLAFFDTNVLLYMDDSSAPEKQERAIQLFTSYGRQRLAVISLQVLQEYFWVATRKLKLPAELVQRKVEVLARGPIVRVTENDVVLAIELHRLTQLSFWDSLIVQAARVAGAVTLFTEDLRHGATLGGMAVVNPFLKND